ncbi:MAG TPA: NPCBM/NEW2 domain-containing protein [Planctomycetota bacterium]|nr:NPCBM/NEW2 domain-containing protein [Planctomycetota bacterium]
MKRLFALPATLALLSVMPVVHAAETTLVDLDISKTVQGWNTPKINQTVGGGRPLIVAKKTYAKGLGTHSVSELWLQLDGKVQTFTGLVGLDDAQNGSGSVEFAIVGDDKLLFRSGVLGSGEDAKPFEVKLDGVKRLLLYVSDGGDGTGNDHADWLEPVFSYAGDKPVTITKPADGKAPELPLANNLRGFTRKIPDGYEATLFAQPPEVSYPVQVCATPTGEVFVAVDKNGSLDRAKNRGSIVRARDTNGDGVADKFDTFVADVDSPRGLSWDGQTLTVLHPPTITTYRDTDGDGKADQVKDIVTNAGYGFDVHSADHTSNGIRQAIDGWIYCAIGDFGLPEAKGTDGSTVTWRGGGILRIRPDGSEIEMYATHTRNVFDVSMDPLLNGFIRDNTNDGDGWNSRLTHLVQTAEYGYPSLYKRFGDDLFAPLHDYGGGSAVGSLFVAEPGLPGEDSNALLTCDWGTSRIYRNPLIAAGAGFEVGEQVEWAQVERVTDVDVDANGNFYASSWRGAVFTFNGDKVGALIRYAPKGHAPVKFPDLAKASDADLVNVHLASTSAICRQQTQNEILRRGAKPATSTALLALAASAKPLPVRVAALFTLKQLDGAKANAAILPLAKDEALQEFVLRALTDRKSQLDGVPLDLYTNALKSSNPRVVKQALIGLNRLGKPAAAAAVVSLTAVASEAKGAERTIPHLAVRALIALNGGDAVLAGYDGATTPEQVNGILWAARNLHDEKLVNGLIARLDKATSERRKLLITTLAHLFYQEGEWDHKHWWGTRPEHQGPYYARAEWAGTPAIATALKAEIAKGGEFATHATAQVEFYKLKIDGVGGDVAKGGNSQADAELLAKAQAASKKAEGKVIANLGYEEVMAGALAAKGDPKLGEQLFLRQGCVACHTITKDGPQKGPYLGEIAKQYGRSELIESIVKPNEKVAQGFTTRWFDMKDGQRLMGFVTSEGAETIQLRNIVGQVMELKTSDIVKRGEDKNSMMPVGLVANLKPEELASILAYFESLVGK